MIDAKFDRMELTWNNSVLSKNLLCVELSMMKTERVDKGK